MQGPLRLIATWYIKRRLKKMNLKEIFDSTGGKGVSKKIIVLFVSGTLIPVLNMLGTPDWIIQILGQLAAVYLGGQSLVDVGVALKRRTDVEAIPVANVGVMTKGGGQ